MEDVSNNYRLIKLLGKGNFGEVYEAIRLSDNQKIALKIITIYNPKDFEALEDEINSLQELSIPVCNPYVVCYYGSHSQIYKDNLGEFRKYLIEMQLIKGKTFTEHMNDMWVSVKKGEKTNSDIYNYLVSVAKDLSEGLEYIHEKGIIHNDLKTDNIMIDENTGKPIIVDFGFACLIDTENNNININNNLDISCRSNKGTPLYAAPEFARKNIRYPSTDMWALGVSLYRTATDDDYIYDNITTWKSLRDKLENYDPKKLNTSNDLLNNIVNGLLIRDKDKRLTASDVIKMSKMSKLKKPFGSVSLGNIAGKRSVVGLIRDGKIEYLGRRGLEGEYKIGNFKNLSREQIISIALSLDLPEILLYCSKFPEFNLSICKNNRFWVFKIQRDYGINYNHLSGAKEYYEKLKNMV